MNCCDYSCNQGPNCPARSTKPDDILMSHATFAIHGHTVTVTGPKAGELTKRIRRAEEAHQARMQDIARIIEGAPKLNPRQKALYESMQVQHRLRNEPFDKAVFRPHKPSRTRRVLRFLRNPWTIAIGLTAATWTASVLLVSRVAGA